MKKKIFKILLFVFMLLPIINVSATCYRKCDYSANPSGNCAYTSTCSENESVSCSTVASDYCNGATEKVSCGNITNIPKKIPELTSFVISLIQIAVPIVLIILGTLDLFKGVSAQKDDDMKKGQNLFVKRLIHAAIIFFVIVIVKLLVSVVANSTTSDYVVDCIDCFLLGTENCN